MSDFNFKVGNKVYCPSISNDVLTLSSSSSSSYPVRIDGATFTTDGRVYTSEPNPSIFPVTQEWYDKLVHVYPNLEKPPVKKSSEEIIQDMLDDGNEGVLCWLSDKCEYPDNSCAMGVVHRLSDDMFVCDADGLWIYATPIMPIKSLKQTIIDYVDGEVVLENEND